MTMIRWMELQEDRISALEKRMGTMESVYPDKVENPKISVAGVEISYKANSSIPFGVGDEVFNNSDLKRIMEFWRKCGTEDKS